MADAIALRKLVTSTLNSNCVDPYDSNSTRNGNQFLQESDDLNLTGRANTFPKGYVTITKSPDPQKSPFGQTGIIKNISDIEVFYFVKERQKYTSNSIVYNEKDLVSYMLKQIKNVLLSNQLTSNGYHLYGPTPFRVGSDIEEGFNGTFKVYIGSIIIRYYWTETY